MKPGERGDFRTINCQDVLAQQGIVLATGESLRLAPHVHGTDGFFAAALQRDSGTNHARARRIGP